MTAALSLLVYVSVGLIKSRHLSEFPFNIIQDKLQPNSNYLSNLTPGPVIGDCLILSQLIVDIESELVQHILNQNAPILHMITKLSTLKV